MQLFFVCESVNLSLQLSAGTVSRGDGGYSTGQGVSGCGLPGSVSHSSGVWACLCFWAGLSVQRAIARRASHPMKAKVFLSVLIGIPIFESAS